MTDSNRPFGSRLTRREVLGLLGGGGLTALGAGRGAAQPAGGSSCVAGSTPAIVMAAKRYDGGSGASVFTGCIPLKPGQLLEKDLATVSLWNAAGTTEIGATVSALYPQHPDGSVKVVRIDATLTLATGVELPLLLRLGTPRVVGGPTPITINAAWMKNPRLIGCTDAAHMCASRVAPGPLVPVDHPNLPAKWKAFLTTEFDSTSPHWPAYGRALAKMHTMGDMGGKRGDITNGSPIITNIVGGLTPATPPTTGLTKGMPVSLGGNAFGIQAGTTIVSVDSESQVTLSKPAVATRTGGYISFGAPYPWQNANYNALAPLYYRYMTTGVLDKLRDAHMLAQDPAGDTWTWNEAPAPAPPGGAIRWGNGLVKYHTDYEGNPANSSFPVDESGQPFNPNPIGGAEWQSGFHQSAYICYVMSGWQQALGVAVCWGLRTLTNTYNGVHFGSPGNGQEPEGSVSTSGARLTWRLMREADVFYYMLSLPMALRQTAHFTTVGDSPRAHRQRYRDYLKAKYYDAADQWSRAFQPTGRPNSFLHGIWGFRPTYAAAQGAVAGGYPAFQSIVFFHTLMWCYMNVVEDDRLPTKLAEHATFLLSLVRGPYTARFGNQGNIPYYTMPYMVHDPASIDLQDGSPDRPRLNMNAYTPAMLLALWVWAYRVTGNTQFLTLADTCATIKAHLYQPGGPHGPSGTGHAFKQIGECYHMAFFAAAWRAGETWGVVSEEGSPKPTPRCP